MKVPKVRILVPGVHIRAAQHHQEPQDNPEKISKEWIAKGNFQKKNRSPGNMLILTLIL